MKKISFFTTLAMVVTMAFSSCIKDDDPIVNENTKESLYTRNWEMNSNTNQGTTNGEPTDGEYPAKLSDNGIYIYYTDGNDRVYFYHDSEGNITKQIIYRNYKTNTAAMKAFTEEYGNVEEATDANGNIYAVNGTFITINVAESQMRFKTVEMVKKFEGRQLFN